MTATWIMELFATVSNAVVAFPQIMNFIKEIKGESLLVVVSSANQSCHIYITFYKHTSFHGFSYFNTFTTSYTILIAL